LNADFQIRFSHEKNIVSNLEDLNTRVTVSFDNKKANRALGMPMPSQKNFASSLLTSSIGQESREKNSFYLDLPLMMS
jgi:hypothetical protein